MEIDAGDNIGEDKNELAEQRHDDKRLSDRADRAHGRMRRGRTCRGGRRLNRFGFGAGHGLQAERIEGTQGLHEIRQ